MARNITTVIDSIVALIPIFDVTPDEIVTLQAELRILKRTAAYAPPEGNSDTELWDRLGTALYRYLPNPAGSAWAKAISDLVTTVSGV